MKNIKKNKKLRLFFILTIIFILTILSGCEKKNPIKIGFVGGLTGAFDELGINGRNGVILAVEECNNAGGINGARLKLICKDDKQDEEQAVKVDKELISEGVEAIIGHMTSTMSVKVLPIINKARIPMISPTTSKLSGLDDYFIRLLPYNETNRPLAQYAYKQLKLRKISILYELSNIDFSKLIRDEITKEFELSGGKIVLSKSFTSGPDIDYIELTKILLEPQPDGLLIIAGAIDIAMICQHLRKSGSKIPVMHNGWAGTDELIQYGGPAIEGIIFPIMYNKDSQNKSFIEYKKRFNQKFGYDPDFAAVYAYEAAQLLFSALSENTDRKKLKDIIINQKLQALQGRIAFDKYGDAIRKTFIIAIENKKIKVLN